MVRNAGLLVGVALVVLALPGCAALPLVPLVSPGVQVASRAGEYSRNGGVDKTFTLPLGELHVATLITFKRMGIGLERDEETDDGREIIGRAAKREIHVTLETITPVTTRMRVEVKEGVLRRDGATASEIVAQTARTVETTPRLAAAARSVDRVAQPGRPRAPAPKTELPHTRTDALDAP